MLACAVISDQCEQKQLRIHIVAHSLPYSGRRLPDSWLGTVQP